jgi:fatty-acyl-CoA synthase
VSVADACVASWLVAAARGSRGLHTLEHDGRSHALSYAVLLEEALMMAGALRARGLATGERVALLVLEVSDAVRAFFGVSLAGLVPVPLCPPAHAGDLGVFMRQTHALLVASRSAAVITSSALAPLLDRAGPGGATAVVAVDELRTGPRLDEHAPVAADATALLQFTSGSTAAPKGVVLSHANLSANVSAIAGPAGVCLRSSDVTVSWLPLYHDMGLIGMLLTSVYAGIDAIILSPVLFLKRPTAWLEAIARHRGTVSFAPNFGYELCLRRVKAAQLETLDLSSWRVAGCGAEPVRAETLERFCARFRGAGFRASSFVPSYGLAEHSLAVTFALDGVKVDRVDRTTLVAEQRAVTAPEDGAHGVRLVACGRPFPGHALEIVDDHGRPLPERHVGRIAVRGPSVMAGYFERPDATDEVLRDGWLLTGDQGYLADGDLFVCGRTKDLIIRQGRKYHPADLEAAIMDLRDAPVSGVVVVGIDRVDHEDEIAAVVELRASSSVEEALGRVRRRVRETAGLELDRVIAAPPGTIPRTTSGKVRRAETRVRLEANTLLWERQDP